MYKSEISDGLRFCGSLEQNGDTFANASGLTLVKDDGLGMCPKAHTGYVTFYTGI